MRLSKTLHLGIAILATVVVVTGAMYVWHRSAIKRLKDIQYRYRKTISEKYIEIDNLKARITILKESLDEMQKDMPDDLLKIYSYDASAGKGNIGFCIWTSDEYTVTQKVKLITALLMKYKFNKGMIELKNIEQRGDKKIAIVHLSETEKHPFAWKGGYFQGSAGGSQTTYVLTNTYLQPHYTGTWIDGVEFWYAGKPVSNDWDHIFLHGTLLRK